MYERGWKSLLSFSNDLHILIWVAIDFLEAANNKKRKVSSASWFYKFQENTKFKITNKTEW